MERDLMELKSLGLFGIYIESIKLITSASFRKIFFQITLALIVPLTFVLFNHMHIGHLLGDLLSDHLKKVYDNPDYTINIRNRLPSKWALFVSLTVLYFIFLLILSLLTTSVVVYTVGSIYASKPNITFKKVMGVVPKVWKRLLVNFLWNFLVIVAFIIVLAIIITVWAKTLAVTRLTTPGLIVLSITLLFYMIGFVYDNLVWQLSNVVSVLEETYGLKAMKKSRMLIKGKLLVAGFIFVIMMLFSLALEVVFEFFVVHGRVRVSVAVRVILGIVCVLLVLGLVLLGLVVQTVIYFVCKSNHIEAIDIPSLVDHLESLRGDYVALKEGGEVQLQVSHV